MEARLTELNENEILKYLGYRSQELTPDLREQIARCAREVTAVCRPRIVYRVLDIENGRIPGLPLPGSDMKKLLDGCVRVVLLGATVGPDVERLTSRTEVTNLSDAVIMDICASTAVENVCNNFEDDLRQEVEAGGQYLTDRYSPGYGDLPLETQRAFCSMLDVQRRIGVTLTKTLLMVPRKSVTAILGIADHPVERRFPGCESCMMFRNCRFRKNGVTCRGEKI